MAQPLSSSWVSVGDVLLFPSCIQYRTLINPTMRSAGELLHVAEPLLAKNLHPTVICKGYARGLEDAVKIVEGMSFPIDIKDRQQMLNVVNSCIATKFTHRFGTLMAVSEEGIMDACAMHREPCCV